MEPSWWTILISAFAHDQTESGLIIRLIRSGNDGTEDQVHGSVDDALRQIRAWLVEMPAPTAAKGRYSGAADPGDERIGRDDETTSL